MPGGRPTKYTPELVEKAREYVDTYDMYDHAFPSDIGLCEVLGISTATLYVWAKDEHKSEFIDILDRINIRQQQVAWNKGLKGEYNANLVKLLLGKHGFSEKNQQEISGPGGGAIQEEKKWTVTFVNADGVKDDNR